MEANKYYEAFSKASPWLHKLAALDPVNHLSCDIQADGSVRINFFPSDEAKAKTARLVLAECRKIIKDSQYGTVTGENDGVTIVVFYALQCDIVGHKTVRKPKIVTTEVEGEFVEEQVPVYECRMPELNESEVLSAN